MVAAGMGVTLVPRLSVPEDALAPVSAVAAPMSLIFAIFRFEEDGGVRRPPAVWCWPGDAASRYEAIAALRNAVYACPLPGVQRLS
jgi:LysR family hydrogen peroxide-inducible transcriptional activator